MLPPCPFPPPLGPTLNHTVSEFATLEPNLGALLCCSCLLLGNLKKSHVSLTNLQEAASWPPSRLTSFMSSPSHFPESSVHSVTTTRHLFSMDPVAAHLASFGLQAMFPACSISLLPLCVAVTASFGIAVSWSDPDALVPLVGPDLSPFSCLLFPG